MDWFLWHGTDVEYAGIRDDRRLSPLSDSNEAVPALPEIVGSAGSETCAPYQTGTSMTDRQVHGAFRDILAIASPSLRPVCEALRHLIESQDAAFHEVVWPRLRIASFGVGPSKMTQHYAYIAVQTYHVNLGFYHGASLRDPARLLIGAGKELRHMKFHDVAQIARPGIRSLLRQAIDERRPYAGIRAL